MRGAVTAGAFPGLASGSSRTASQKRGSAGGDSPAVHPYHARVGHGADMAPNRRDGFGNSLCAKIPARQNTAFL